MNRRAQPVFKILAADQTTGEWLFTNRDDEPIKAIKKGFDAACVRGGIEDLRAYDLRHTFTTRLLEANSLRRFDIKLVGAWGFEPQTPTVSR